MAHSHQQNMTNQIEDVALAAWPAISSVSAVRAMDAYGYIDLPQIQSLPGAGHSSSILASYSIGVAGGAVTAGLVEYCETRGSIKCAKAIRKIGNAATWFTSVFYQSMFETYARGAYDKWDILYGAAATLPGIYAGRGLRKIIAAKD